MEADCKFFSLSLIVCFCLATASSVLLVSSFVYYKKRRRKGSPDHRPPSATSDGTFADNTLSKEAEVSLDGSMEIQDSLLGLTLGKSIVQSSNSNGSWLRSVENQQFLTQSNFNSPSLSAPPSPSPTYSERNSNRLLLQPSRLKLAQHSSATFKDFSPMSTPFLNNNHLNPDNWVWRDNRKVIQANGSSAPLRARPLKKKPWNQHNYGAKNLQQREAVRRSDGWLKCGHLLVTFLVSSLVLNAILITMYLFR